MTGFERTPASWVCFALFVAATWSYAGIDAEYARRINEEEIPFHTRFKGAVETRRLEDVFRVIREQDVGSLPSAVSYLESIHEEELLLILLEDGTPYGKLLSAQALERIATKRSLSRIIRCLNRENEYFQSARSDAEFISISMRFHGAMISTIERISGVIYGHEDTHDRDLVLDYIHTVGEQGRRSNKGRSSVDKLKSEDSNDYQSKMHLFFWGGFVVAALSIWGWIRFRNDSSIFSMKGDGMD